MFLKRLELHGFKSFAPRTTLEFSPGITAIVGPNGSGKSNIADSIRWVLGEQSMRQLRGKRSDDVIFAGGQGRATMQMAEVGLVLDNSSAWLPSEFTEVTAARRSFRNGESEYLVNGQRVRLKDVLLLLAQARIGHDSYTVIGQGLVDQALSQRAEERRALFEDAAGIRQFQAQRNDAEQKLTLTQTNLARLRDIVGEIEPRLAPLAEQARRAREFSGAHEELRRLLQIWYRQQWLNVHAACERAEATEREYVTRIQKLQDALAVEDALILEKREQHQALLTQLATVRRARGETASALQSAERDVAVARERLASLDRQESDLGGEQEQQSDAVAVAQAHVGALEAQLERAEEQADTATSALDTLEKGLHAARQEQEREEARLRAAQRDVIQIQARLGAAQTELGRLQRQLGERNRGLAARRETAALAQRKLEVIEAQVAERKEIFDAAHTGVEAMVAQREQYQRELVDGQREAERLRAAVADQERERAALKDRLALLEEWQRNLEGFSDGARSVLQATDPDCPPILGALAQLISAPAGTDLAIETACGLFLQAIVVASRQDAKRAATWLAASGGGRATFLWPEEQSADGREEAMPEPDSADWLGYARDIVTCSPEIRSIVTRVLGATYIVRDLSVVEARWDRSALPVPIVTLDGDMVHPRGWLRGGRSKVTSQQGGRDAGVLGRERELRRLPAAIEQVEAAIAEVKAQFTRQQEALGLLTTRLTTLAKELKEAEGRAQELAKAVTALQREQERAQNEVGLSDAVTEQLAAEIRGLEQEVTVTIARVAEQETAQQDATERVEAIQEEVDDLQSRHRGQQDELARARTAAAVQKQEVKALTQRVEQLRAQMKELQTQMARREQRLQAIRLQRDELTQTVSGYDAAIEASRERMRTLTDELRAVEQRQGELERQMHELE
ncbi:MAG TPA: chromosome segregation protein SMC, partial [Ktedonobacterales bacterium]